MACSIWFISKMDSWRSKTNLYLSCSDPALRVSRTHPVDFRMIWMPKSKTGVWNSVTSRPFKLKLSL